MRREIDSRSCAHTNSDRPTRGTYNVAVKETLLIISHDPCTSLRLRRIYFVCRQLRLSSTNTMPSSLSSRAISAVCIFLYQHRLVGATAIASLKDKMFHAILDSIRIDFASELTLLKVCIYCWRSEHKKKKLFVLCSSLLSVGRHACSFGMYVT